MTLREVKAKVEAGAEVGWWSWRYLSSAVEIALHGGQLAEDELAYAQSRFAWLASLDPSGASQMMGDSGPLHHLLAALFQGCDLEAFVETVSIADPIARARFLARFFVLLSKAHPPREDKAACRERAWRELESLPDADRDESWPRLARACAWQTDFGAYKGLIRSFLAEAPQFAVSMELPDAILVAADKKEWASFEAWVAAYRALPPALQRGHSSCEIFAAEGLRALAEGRKAAALECLKKLVVEAQDAEFLANESISSFPKAMKAAGLGLEACARFDELVALRDWRALPSPDLE
ncbi:MAG: hypothetical protein GQE15_18760 [Archangiaceae bacterium]|mgnify:CR=1 FL=1|nr:hypothetical protein [Archangiaceae bacterium]